jgi:hypothetical protein
VDFEMAGLPDEYWPSMVTGDVPGVYRELVDDTLRCARLLQESVAAVGTALDGVARHYRRMEDRHGKDFDALGRQDVRGW